MRMAILASIAVFGCGGREATQHDAAGDDDAAPPCAGEVCECTVATQDADCGRHEVCDETGPGRRCTCAPAYKLAGGTCVFDGAPLDRGFADPAKWTAIGAGVAVVPDDAGNLDPGAGVVSRNGFCMGGSFVQSFVMPPRSKADAFKLAVTAAGVDPAFDLFDAQTSAGVGGAFGDAPVGHNVFRRDAFCLGPRAYGHGAGSPVDFVAGAFPGASYSCTAASAATVNIDQIALQVADPGECPEPSTVVNGDFEAAGGAGWQFTGVIQGATAAIMPGIGDGATAGARLATANRCSEATMVGTIAFDGPALANQAIEVSFTGTAGARLAVQLGGKNIATLDGTGVNKKVHVCVPEWAVGTTTNLGFFMQRNSNSACTTALARTFTIDNIKIVADATCDSTQNLTDPGFERVANVTGPAPGWGLTNGYANDLETGTVVIVSSPGAAHSGTGSLRFGATNECALRDGAAAADFALVVPPAQGTAGPAVKFFAKAAATNAKTTLRASIVGGAFGGAGSVDVPETGAYVETKLCLPPGLVGRRVGIRFQLSDSDGGSCAVSYPEESAFVDDISIGTDAGCPAQ